MQKDRDEMVSDAAKAEKERENLKLRCMDLQKKNKEIKVPLPQEQPIGNKRKA